MSTRGARGLRVAEPEDMLPFSVLVGGTVVETTECSLTVEKDGVRYTLWEDWFHEYSWVEVEGTSDGIAG